MERFGVEKETYDSSPMMSQSNCPSFLRSVLIFPAVLINWTPCIHSSTVRFTSLAKSWTCRIRDGMISRSRGLAFGPVALMTF